MDAGPREDFFDLIGAGHELSGVVAVEECPVGIVGVFESFENSAAFLGDCAGCFDAFVHDGCKVGVGEVESFF